MSAKPCACSRSLPVSAHQLGSFPARPKDHDGKPPGVRMTRATASGYSRSHVRMHPHPARLPPAFGASASSSEVTPPQAYSARPGTVDNTTAAQPAAIVAAMLFCAHHQASHGEPRRAIRKGTASRGPRVWVRLRGRRQAGAPQRLQQLDVVVARLSASGAFGTLATASNTAPRHVVGAVRYIAVRADSLDWMVGECQ